MKVVYSIDWLTLTRLLDPTDSIVTDAAIADPVEFAARVGGELESIGVGRCIKRIPSVRPYRVGFEVEYNASLYAAGDLVRQGVMLRLPGKFCSQRQGDLTAIMALAADAGWRCTRIDVTADVHGAAHEFGAIKEFVEKVAQKKNMTTGYFSRASGKTLYLGSRTSDRMLRIYDKAAEMGIDADITRWEYEVKGEYARAVYSMVIKHGVAKTHGSITESLIGTFIDSDCPASAALLSSGAGVVYRCTKKQPDRRAYFENQVLPAFKNWLKSDPASARDWFYRLATQAYAGSDHLYQVGAGELTPVDDSGKI